MEGRIFSMNVRESMEREMMESGLSSFIDFSVCLGMECLVLILRPSSEGMLKRNIKEIMKRYLIGCGVFGGVIRYGRSLDRL